MKKSCFFRGLFATTLIIATLISILILAVNGSRSQQTFNDGISVDSFLRFIEVESAMENDGNLKSLNTVEISRKNDNDGNAYYFVKTNSQFMWGSELYMLIIDDDKITKIVDTGLGGNSEYFSYDVASISQGVFVSAFCSSHSGNGDLRLMPINEPNTVEYLIPNAVDNYYEESELTAIEHEITKANGKSSASSVYLGGKLHASYVDVNHDGHTDIVLTGIQQIYETVQNHGQTLKKEYFVKNVYLYDPIMDDFVYNATRSERVLVSNYLTP